MLQRLEIYLLNFNSIYINQHKVNQKLDELKDWLLPVLMNGQVTFAEVKSELGMVSEDNVKNKIYKLEEFNSHKNK